jgi:hypothetical protein
MPIEQGVIEEQVSRMAEQLRWVGTLLRQCALAPKSTPDLGRRFGRSYRSAGKRFEKIPDATDKLVAQPPKFLRTHRQRRNAFLQSVVVVHSNPQQNLSGEEYMIIDLQSE